MLISWRSGQDMAKEAMGDEYRDYGLVLPDPFGMPMEASRINAMFHDLIEKHDLL